MLATRLAVYLGGLFDTVKSRSFSDEIWQSILDLIFVFNVSQNDTAINVKSLVFISDWNVC